MDLLYDHLMRARATGAVFARTVVMPPWGLRLGGSIQLAVHAVTRGKAWLWLDDPADAVELRPGEISLVRGGSAHHIAHEPGACCLDPTEFRAQYRQVAADADRGATVFLCGAYQFSGDVARGLLDALPRVLTLSSAVDEPLREVIVLVSRELANVEPGQQTVLDRLLDVLLILALRSDFRRSATAPRWYRASGDPRLHAALQAMHSVGDHDRGQTADHDRSIAPSALTASVKSSSMGQPAAQPRVAVTFAGSGDAFGSGGRNQACIHLGVPGQPPVLLDCGATSLSALKACGLNPGEIGTVFISHLHGDHFGGLPFLILDGQFSRRASPLTVAGPPGTAGRLQQAMETSFPGSSGARRGFGVEVIELAPGSASAVNGIEVTSWEVDHPSGAPPLALRLCVGSTTIAYTGDTAWTENLAAAADDADLLIAEAYYYDKAIPFHLRYTDLITHRASLASRRIVLTHMSADMLARAGQGQLAFETARDGLVIQL